MKDGPEPRDDTSQHPRRVWLLDIDGTLMPTQELDNRCYWRAIDDVVGGAPACLDLDGFAHVTDGGILDEWMRRTHGRTPTAAETTRIRRRFLDLLADEHRRCPSAFEPLPGLVPWLEAARADGTDRIALATGGWSHTARFKLRAAGLARWRLPLASSDDAGTRTGIMRIARQRALAGSSRTAGTGGTIYLDDNMDDAPTTYIGDGPWDLRASRDLGWDFVGIGSGSAAERLAAAGAVDVFDDFLALVSRMEHGRRANAACAAV